METWDFLNKLDSASAIAFRTAGCHKTLALRCRNINVVSRSNRGLSGVKVFDVLGDELPPPKGSAPLNLCRGRRIHFALLVDNFANRGAFCRYFTSDLNAAVLDDRLRF